MDIGNKINIAELLKDCPTGMELDCTMYDNCTFDGLEEYLYHIKVQTPDGRISLNKYGCYSSNKQAKCIIFPKGKTTWEGFVPPCEFKDGDIVATTNGLWIGITTGGKSGESIPTYCVTTGTGGFEAYFNYREKWKFQRFATEEEKQKLFNAIKANGYKWNADSKTLEKLTPNKFDITTLKPFDRVLVRDNNSQKWTADLFSFYDKSLVYPYSCIGHYTNQCVPFESNKHLLGTTDDCDEYFKNWE